MRGETEKRAVVNGMHTLANFQLDRVVALQHTAQRIVSSQVAQPEQREGIAKESGVVLLQAPTGSGKTLMLARALEGLKGKLASKCVWFWFAPYTGIVSQTREAITEQSPGLRLRDAARDREPSLAQDGDVFVQTWASVAANKKDARVIRRTSEDKYGLDAMLEMLRLDGFSIGVVIDEAHLNFGVGASAASSFYLETLRPDITVLASATPNDEKLEKFADKTGLKIKSRLIVSREDVVDAGLNKTGLMLGYLSIKEEDEALVDTETAILTAAWHQHQRVRKRLDEKGIGVTPLMLVQVENDGDDPDPVARVRSKLEAIGIEPGLIAAHTSKEPDADFHTIAFDPSREVLIFKMAAATGFDAPRAWTLVSVRPNRDKNFGLQIVGRIMRVHAGVRPYHQTDPLLDRGYVFLGDLGAQEGLKTAADTLEAVESSVSTICDRLYLTDLGGDSAPLRVNEAGNSFLSKPLQTEPPKTAEERQMRLEALIAEQRVPAIVRERPSEEQDRAIIVAEGQKSWEATDLFSGKLPEQLAPKNQDYSPSWKAEKTARYDLKPGLVGFDCFQTELPPHSDVLNSDEFNDALAHIFLNQSNILKFLFTDRTSANLSFEDVFTHAMEDDQDGVQIQLDDARIVREGQLAFNFHKALDDRIIKRSLSNAVISAAKDNGYPPPSEEQVARAIYLAAMKEPEKLKAAQREAYARHVKVGNAEILPPFHMDYPSRPAARLNLYGVLPSGLNNPEMRFVQLLDKDDTGLIKWWVRLPSRAGGTRGWNPGLILPNGRYFFPDFAIAAASRSTPDEIVLAEVKGEQAFGDPLTIAKIRMRQRSYGLVKWVEEETEQLFMRLAYNETHKRIVQNGVFEISDLQYE